MGATIPQLLVIEGVPTDYMARVSESARELRVRAGLDTAHWAQKISERVGFPVAAADIERVENGTMSLPSVCMWAAIDIAGLPSMLRDSELTRLQAQITELADSVADIAESQLS